MEQNQDTSLFGINVDQAGRSHLGEAARWAKFLSIIGFIVCGIIVLVGVFFGSVFSTLTSRYGNSPYDDFPSSAASGLGTMAAVFYIIFALIYFIPTLFLYRFASKMKTALASNNQVVLNTSFQNLKACFRFVGILTIIMIAFWLLAVIVGLLGAATGGRM
ncbi:MAG TPA: DUF5362 family protein [Chitinophagaceae bacterium]|nr:DUF5362 family protein [Chitinophagaceae bacterium]